jgi:hypothetical protein
MGNNWLDIQHRGFSAYLQEVANEDESKKLTGIITRAKCATEQVDTVFLDCRVETDWIEQIEASLPFVENAIHQNRQFILRQGETVPIEKARRVSKASVVHLSRHSELITTEPEPGENLIPDRIYMAENISTYTVYENRFLYMLLCYIRDFTDLRYRKIADLAASFSSDISMRKDITDGTRKITYHLQFSETSRGVDSSIASEAETALLRLRKILQTVELLLKTNLMQEVSTAPLLKPPIVRNNVMLHDPNFQTAFELYAYLDSYTKDGYEKIERHRSSGEFSHEMREDFANLIAMTSYLSYRNGGFYETLEKRYLAEEQRRKEAAQQALKDKCDSLRAHLGAVSGPVLDYILALEQWAGGLEDQSEQIAQARALQAEAEGNLLAAQERVAALQTACAELDAQLRQRNEDLQRSTQQSQQALNMAQQQLQQMKQERDQARQEAAGALEQQKQEFLMEYATLAEKYRLANARYRGLAQHSGTDTGEIPPTKEAFAELEAEYEAFRRYFDRQWKAVKKHIRKEQLWKK